LEPLLHLHREKTKIQNVKKIIQLRESTKAGIGYKTDSIIGQSTIIFVNQNGGQKKKEVKRPKFPRHLLE
jgi:hypothetical protein